MNWLFLALGVALGMAGGAGGGQYLAEKFRYLGGDDVVLAAKYFVDDDDYVVVSGTLLEPNIGVANNSYTIACYKERKECWIASFRQTDAKSISRIEPPYALDIAQWTASEITALADGALGCQKITITIGRKTKRVRWVDEPVNRSQPKCKAGETQARTLSIEDSPGWKKLRQAGYGPQSLGRP